MWSWTPISPTRCSHRRGDGCVSSGRSTHCRVGAAPLRMPPMARGRLVIASGLLALSLGLAPTARAATDGDLITDNGFESSTAGFEASSALDGSVSLDTE